MRLKKDADVVEFMRGIKSCKGGIFFESPEDRIDLKSILSRYVFISILGNRKLIESGEICCEDTEDFKKLEPYLE